MSIATQKNRLGNLFTGGLPEFDNLFNHFFRAEEVAMWRAPASIWEADNTFHIEVDAAGVLKEDVELTFDKGTLQITLERKAPEGERTRARQPPDDGCHADRPDALHLPPRCSIRTRRIQLQDVPQGCGSLGRGVHQRQVIE